MHLSDRVQASPDLEWRLEREVAILDMGYLCDPVACLGRLLPHGLCRFVAQAVGAPSRVTDLRLLRALGCKNGSDYRRPREARRRVGWQRFATRFSNVPCEKRSTAYEVPILDIAPIFVEAFG
jgi:hypothetical protein